MHHLTDCGLPDTYVADGYERTPEGVTIHDPVGLHEAIGDRLAHRPSRIDGNALRFLRTTLGATPEVAASWLCLTGEEVRRKEADTGKPLPGPEDRIMRLIWIDHARQRDGVEGAVRVFQVLERLADLDEVEASKELYARRGSAWRWVGPMLNGGGEAGVDEDGQTRLFA